MPSLPRADWLDAYSTIQPAIDAGRLHNWPFRPELPLDVRFLAFGPKRIPANRHDYLELLFVHSGSAVYDVAGQQQVRLDSGDLFLVGNDVLHGVVAYPHRRLKATVLYFLPELVRGGEEVSEELLYLSPFLVRDRSFPYMVSGSSPVPAQVLDLMTRIRAELPAVTARARLAAKTYLKMILVLLVNHFADYAGDPRVFRRRQEDLDRLRPLFELIEKNYGEPLPVDRAARTLGMSRTAFSRFFKKVTGQSLVCYLNHFRVAKAEVLLRETDLPIVDVALSTGFRDQSYFGLVFRTIIGLPPREYKQAVVAQAAHPPAPR